jgi:AbrB family looped-hinge helix DNA binding protein
MTLATLTSQGQATIPKVVRDSLQLQAGDKVEFVLSDAKEVLFRPIAKRLMMASVDCTSPAERLFPLNKWTPALNESCHPRSHEGLGSHGPVNSVFQPTSMTIL